MDDDAMRQLLEDVRDGTVSPEEAAEHLRRARGTGSGGESAAGWDEHDDEPPVYERADASGVRAVRVRALAGQVRVVGDASVAAVRVEGHHRLREEDGVLVVENDVGADGDGPLRGLRVGGFRLEHRPGGLSLRRAARRGTVLVQVNPALPLEIDCDAADVRATDVGAPLTVRVSAGNATVSGFDGSVDAAVSAGNLRLRGTVRGASRLDCNVGRIDLVAEPGSDVRVTRSTNLGSLDLDDDVFGRGTHVLEVSCNLGAVRVRSAETASAGAG